ncbi:MAG: hypothetical protein KAG56_08145 [Sulfurovaceae bacterium]|nr:hypothetical protein [Sulfurovaceae bacterium]
MKKFLLMSALVTSVMFASGDADKKVKTKEEKMHQMQTMQNLETGMATIQKGFLYNNTSLVKDGIEKLKLNIDDIQDFKIENDQDLKFDAQKYAKAEMGAIKVLAEDMMKDFDAGKKEKVLDGFQKTLNRCITCHLIVRQW